MYSITTNDTALLISTAVLLMLVLIMLLNKRSSAYKKYNSANYELKLTQRELDRLKLQLAKAKKKQPATKPAGTDTIDDDFTVESGLLYKKPIDNLEHLVQQINSHHQAGNFSQATDYLDD